MTTGNDSLYQPADILVVDDTVANLRLLSDILVQAGYRVRPVEQPEQGIKSALAHPPDLIILDLWMPNMNGFEVCRRLRQNASTRDIPVIFVSASREISDKVEGFVSGGVDFISKPFQELEVLARVRTHLQLRHMQLHLEDMVSDRTRALEEAYHELHESEVKYRSLVEQAQDGVTILQDKKIKFVNPYLASLQGYTVEELLDTCYSDYIPSDELPKIVEMYQRRMNGESVPNVYESAIQAKDGSRREVEFSAGRTLYNGQPADLVIVRDIRERKKAEAKLQQYQLRLKALASQLTLAEEQERRRIAGDLHDNIAQSLAFARLRLQAARKIASGNELKGILDEISDSLLLSVKEARHLIFDLSPPAMSELGLASAISEWLEERVQNRYGLETEVIDRCGKVSIEDDVLAIVFRSVRELLANVVKHAQAGKVIVCLEKQDVWLKVAVEDNGVGCQGEPPQKMTMTHGFGIFSIQERMSDLGGGFKIESTAGKGCRVVLTVPISQNHQV